MKKLKVGFYSPFLDSLGGGERYVLALASYWAKKHKVELFWDDFNIKDDVRKRLNIDLSRVKVTRNIFRKINVFKKLFLTCQYDLIFVLSDGSVPGTWSPNSILHFQCPFPQALGRGIINQFKLKRYSAVVCNSKFTKRFIDKEYDVKSVVIYPPVSVDLFRPGEKEKIILSVGRFSTHFINKKQIEMVGFFRQLQRKHREWKLVLAGGLLEQDRPYFDRVQEAAQGLSVEILPNLSFDQLVTLYKKASIYWHAAGYREDQEQNPAAMEHFGISTVEAMSAGAVPIVFAGGGQTEIIHDGANGFLWRSTKELLSKTSLLIYDTKEQQRIRDAAVARAMDFQESKFTQSFDNLIVNIT